MKVCIELCVGHELRDKRQTDNWNMTDDISLRGGEDALLKQQADLVACSCELLPIDDGLLFH